MSDRFVRVDPRFRVIALRCHKLDVFGVHSLMCLVSISCFIRHLNLPCDSSCGFRFAFSVPVPPFPGNPLDPPLRSRFQVPIALASKEMWGRGGVCRGYFRPSPRFIVSAAFLSFPCRDEELILSRRILFKPASAPRSIYRCLHESYWTA